MRNRIIRAACATLVASLAAAAPAIAAPAVSVQAPASTTQDTQVDVVYSGTADAGVGGFGMTLRVFYELNAASCAPSSAGQLARPKSVSDGVQYISDPGPFSATSPVQFSANGAYRFCAYLEVGTSASTTPPAAFADAVVQVGPVPIPCTVPQLSGLTLAAATKRLRAAGCDVGKVTKPKKAGKKTLIVKSQGKRSGTRLGSGAKISLVLQVKKGKK